MGVVVQWFSLALRADGDGERRGGARPGGAAPYPPRRVHLMVRDERRAYGVDLGSDYVSVEPDGH